MKEKVFRQRIRICVAVIVFMFLFLVCRQEVFAAGTANKQAETLSLYNKNPNENALFEMTNMFPGDSKTQYYRVKVSYTGTITVSFRATVKEGDKKLGEGLEAKVRMVNSDQVIYEGTIGNMPKLDYIMTAGDESKTEEICYEVVVGLSTDVGNEYQNQNLNVDLEWWVEDSASEDESEEPNDEEIDGSQGGTEDGGSLINQPRTGDDSHLTIWIVTLIVTMTAMLLVLMKSRRKVLLTGDAAGAYQTVQYEQSGQINERRKKLISGIILIVLSILAFSITSLALIYQKVTVEKNVFQTGEVSICLNDNKPVFAEDMLFEPGMVVEKDFTLRNDSTCDVYYRLYFSEIEGEFAEVLTVTVSDGEDVIFQGTLAEMNGVKAQGASSLLKVGELRKMKITFHVPENCGNLMQNSTILFDLNADAVQAVNNPDGLF